MKLNLFKTELIKKHNANQARITKITTPHGEIITPAFMPVGTRAFVNQMTTPELLESGTQIILGGNTYHMLVSPGTEIIESAGGMHRFMNWPYPMLTDSGGFQIFSLSQNKKICTIDENGAHFKHPITGKVIHMDPIISIETQRIIGADMIMAFDQCTPDVADEAIVQNIMQRTHRWLTICKEYQQKNPQSVYGFKQALFGIIQGGSFRHLREQSAEYIVNADLDGIAIGGESIGFDMKKTTEIIDWIRPILPEEKTRYTMGVGLDPKNLIDVVAAGVDIFDCVAPTRNARHGALYSGKIIFENNWVNYLPIENQDRILIKKSIYAKDEKPIIEDCACFTCQNYSRAYLHYLFKQKLAAFFPLACIHNIFTMHAVCEAMKKCIENH